MTEEQQKPPSAKITKISGELRHAFSGSVDQNKNSKKNK